MTQSQISSTDTVLSYSVTGTATPGAGQDYTALSGTVTIPAMATSADIDVAVLDDNLVEAVETVTVTLTSITSSAPGITVDNANKTATVSIADDDTATVSIARIGDGAEAATPVAGKFRVTQSKPSSTDTVLSYTVNGTATPGAGSDYTPLSGTVTISAGATTADIDVAVVNDSVVESDETVIVTLAGITSADPQITINQANKAATVSIADDDVATVSIAKIGDATEAAVPTNGKFRVTQTLVSATDTVLSYTVSGTATPGAGQDYTQLSGTVTIAAGATTADIDVAVLNDDLVEGPETVTVTLAAISSADPQIAIAVPNNPATLSIGDDDVASVSIAKLADGAEAGTTHGTFQVSQTKASSTATVLNYTVSGTAMPGAGQDYTPLSGSVTIAAGSLTANIDVAVLNDDLVESTETVVVSLSAVASGAAEISINTAEQTASLDIRDDDAATVSIDRVSDGAEGSALVNGRFRVTQTKASAADTVLSYLVAGTATAGDDYQLLSGTVTIAAGSTTADIIVSVRNDSLVESTETVIVTLSAVTSGDPDVTINQANKTATVSILDDPTTVSIAATSPTASEPGAQKGQFTVSLASGRQAPLGGIQVSYTVSGSAAAGTDYTALSGVATIPAGQSSVQISVDALNDNVVELPETVSVTLTGTNHPSVAIAPAGNQATVTINDDDPTTVSIAASDPSGSEPGADDGQFTVTLGGGTVAPAGGIVVSYTVSGTATGGTDYTALAGTVTIPAGQSFATIPVDVLDDNIVELPETVILTLTGTNHAAVTVQATANTASVTIIDGAGENTVSIAATDATGNEPGADDGLLTVALAGGKLAPGGGIAVTYTISGTATAGSDYTALSGTVTIPAGQSSATIPVDVLNDNIVEVSGDGDRHLDGHQSSGSRRSLRPTTPRRLRSTTAPGRIPTPPRFRSPPRTPPAANQARTMDCSPSRWPAARSRPRAASRSITRSPVQRRPGPTIRH